MSNVLVQESSLKGIANAIRSVNGLYETYTPAQMPAAISDLQKTLITKAITQNGVFPAADDHADGYSQVAVDVHPGMKVPIAFDLDTGYVQNGDWIIGGQTINYSDVYWVLGGKTYIIALGQTVGTRFRGMFSIEDTSQATDDIDGIQIMNNINPPDHSFSTYKQSSDGYITITKDNAGTANIPTFVFCLMDMVDENS